MPNVRTRLQLEARARFLADAVNDDNVEDDDLHDEVNNLLGELHGIVFERDPDRFLRQDTITTTTGTQSYELPDDFMSIRRVDYVNGDVRTMLTEAAPLLEMDFSQNAGGSSGAAQYRVMGSGADGSEARLWLVPDPGDATYELWYVAGPPTLSDDTDELDVVTDWHSYIVYGLAAAIADRQETDSAPFRLQQERARLRIETQATKRDSGRAKQITDVRSQRMSVRDRYPRP